MGFLPCNGRRLKVEAIPALGQYQSIDLKLVNSHDGRASIERSHDAGVNASHHLAGYFGDLCVLEVVREGEISPGGSRLG